MVKQLGEQGLVSVTDDMNMENYQKMEDFYSAYISGMDAMATVFSVQMEGDIGALTFVHRNGKIQSYHVTVGWQEGGIPELKKFGLNDLEEIKLTRKYIDEPFRTDGGLIPTEIYERVMTTCFPVSVEQVQEYCGYHADAGGYGYEMIFARQFPPFGEVVDYKQNEDGTFRYLSNTIF